MTHKSWKARAMRNQPKPAPATIRDLHIVRIMRPEVALIERVVEQQPGNVWEYRRMVQQGGVQA